MARGNFWEMTYDPDWDGPSETASFGDSDGNSGRYERVIRASDGRSVTVRWKATGPERLFQRCDIRETVKDSLVSNCTFTDCRFKDSRWEDVKFSNCTFVRCDFSDVVFLRCYFVNDCRFEHNSASAELFRVDDTAISAAAFIESLETNLQHAVNPSYQKHRFVGTRQKLAKALFSAIRDEANVDYYFEAYEQLTRCTLAQRIEQHRFTGRDRVSRRHFWITSAPARFEQYIILASGWLTQWGRSLLRACGFFVTTVCLFAFVYSWLAMVPSSATCGQVVFRPIVQAINITLVAGYTSYFDRNASWFQQVAWLLNLTLGIFWYSLVVPVLSRRVLR